MPRLLKDLTITEVSSVDRGAGRGVKVMLYKRDAPANPAAPPGEIEMTKEELDAVVKAAATEAVTKALETVNAAQAAELAKRDYEITLLKMSDTHKAYMGTCGADAQKSFAAMTPEQRDDYMSKNPVRKREEPVLNADLAKRDETIAKLASDNTELKKRLDAADLEKAQVSFKKQAADIGLTKDGDGEIMRKAYAGDAASQAELTKRQAEVFAALKKQAETGGLFNEFGTAKGAAGDAQTAIMSKAVELRKADPKLTVEQAFAKAYKDPANAELVTASQVEENRARLRVV